jgi:hypothetical protein
MPPKKQIKFKVKPKEEIKEKPKPKTKKYKDYEEFTLNGIDTEMISVNDGEPEYFKFDSNEKGKMKNLILSGTVDREKKRIKIDFFLSKKTKSNNLAKGEAREILCKYFKSLIKINLIDKDYEIVLYADPRFGSGQQDLSNVKERSMEGLVKLYESMSFKKFGKIAFGNQPMQTTVKSFIEFCDKYLKRTK